MGDSRSTDRTAFLDARRSRAVAQAARRAGTLAFLATPPAPPAASLASCLRDLQQAWQQDDSMAALWQAWPRLAGPQLAAHCRPLDLRGGLLSVGAAPGPWLQALQYNRHQLLGALRGAGFAIRDLRIRQHHEEATATPGSVDEAEVWARHPSRCEVHGMGSCGACGRPAPAGEMALWGHCSFCRRAALEDQGSSPGSSR